MADVMLTDEVVMDYHSCPLVLKSTSLGTYFLPEHNYECIHSTVCNVDIMVIILA